MNDLIGDKVDQGEKGEQGVSITKVEKTSSNGLVDTYTITFSNGTIEEWRNIIFGDYSYFMHYAKHLFVLNENDEYVEVDLSQLQ